MMQNTQFDPIEEEVNAIRLSIYEEIKNMTPDEMAHYFITQTDPVIKQFHMKMSPLRPMKPINWEEHRMEYSEDPLVP